MKKTSTIKKKEYCRKKRDVVIKRSNHPFKQLLISDYKHSYSECERHSCEQRHHLGSETCLDEQQHLGGNITSSVRDYPQHSERRILFDQYHPLSIPKFIYKEGADILCYVNDHTVDIHIKFRNVICAECGWSIPTYYRRVGSKMKLSNAEFEKICQVSKDLLIDAVVDFYAKTSCTTLEAHSIYKESWSFAREGNFNTLWYLHYRFASASREMRDEICLQCGWSMPTYYRKVREAKSLSNADFEKSCNVYKDYLVEMLTDFHRFSRGLWPFCNT
jgi:hypothetical protein